MSPVGLHLTTLLLSLRNLLLTPDKVALCRAGAVVKRKGIQEVYRIFHDGFAGAHLSNW